MQELLCIKINSVKNLFQFSISYLSQKKKKISISYHLSQLVEVINNSFFHKSTTFSPSLTINHIKVILKKKKKKTDIKDMTKLNCLKFLTLLMHFLKSSECSFD